MSVTKAATVHCLCDEDLGSGGVYLLDTKDEMPAGVSNMTAKKLKDLLSYARIKPAVNQIEIHPYWRNEKTRQFCKENASHQLLCIYIFEILRLFPHLLFLPTALASEVSSVV